MSINQIKRQIAIYNLDVSHGVEIWHYETIGNYNHNSREREGFLKNVCGFDLNFSRTDEMI